MRERSLRCPPHAAPAARGAPPNAAPARSPAPARSLRRAAALAACALLPAALPAAPSAAPPACAVEGAPDGLEAGVEAAQERLVARLDEIATWCGERRLFAFRDDLFHAILRFDPQNFRAHKGLKHSQDRDGNWHLPEDPVPEGVNYSPSELPEAERMRSEAVAAYRDACLALLDGAGEGLPAAERDAVLDTVLWVAPDDARVRELRGQVRDEETGEWLLEETLVARESRARLRELAERALEESASVVGDEPPIAEEQAIGVAWSAVAATGDVRVLATGGDEESRRVARASHAMGDFFRSLFDTQTPLWADLTVFVLRGAEERDAFLDTYAAVPEDMRETYRSFVGTGFPDSPNVAVWQPNPLERLDFASRHALGALLRNEFGITPGHGWAWEGFGLYLNRRLVRTRLTWYSGAAGSAEAQELRVRLAQPDGNWMGEAHRLLSSGEARLADLFEKGLNEMSARDMAVAYALAAYLVEGHPDEVAPLLDAVGNGGASSAEAVESATGMDARDLQRRLIHWMEERR